jgi:selenocysteine lyase/cysteine desulfurase
MVAVGTIKVGKALALAAHAIVLAAAVSAIVVASSSGIVREATTRIRALSDLADATTSEIVTGTITTAAAGTSSHGALAVARNGITLRISTTNIRWDKVVGVVVRELTQLGSRNLDELISAVASKTSLIAEPAVAVVTGKRVGIAHVTDSASAHGISSRAS